MILLRFSVRFIGFISTIILARLLVPEDFGLVALATIIAGLLEVVSEFNFAIYLIKKQDADRSYYDTAWTLTLLRGFAIAALLAIGAHQASVFFEKSELEAIIYCLALASLVEGFSNVGTVDFRKQLQFDREFRFMLYMRLVAFVVTLGLAFLIRNYWALVAGLASGKIAMVFLSYGMHPYRPRWCLSRSAEILAFSKWLLFNQGILFFSRRADVFVIGKVAGPGALGLYSVGQEIAMLASSELVMPIHRALLPGYARLADDMKGLRRAYTTGLSLILMLALPVAAGIALVAEPLVSVALGSKWLETVPLIQVLVIAGLLQLFRANTHPMLIAMGVPQLTTAIAAAVAVTAIPLLVWWTPIGGAYAAAWAITLATGVGVILNLLVIVGVAKIGIGEITKAIWRSLASTLSMVIAVRFGLQWVAALDCSELLTLCFGVLIGILSYASTHALLWYVSGKPEGSERHFVNAVQDALL